MKVLLSILFILASSSLFANDLLDLADGKKPLCSSPFVRLSPKPIPCIPDLNDDGLFDIPSLELDLEDLEKIFEGAESSGGRVIGPMNTPRTNGMPVTPYPVYLKCEARLLLDGGKKVSFLSKQSFGLNSRNHTRLLYTDQWTHGITELSTLYPENWVRVPVTPKVEFKNYSVRLGYNSFSSKATLSVCEANLKTAGGETALTCSEVEFNRYAYEANLRLNTLVIKELVKIKKTLNISCQIR